jgi:DNA-binding transcriptional ArsR family regulator
MHAKNAISSSARSVPVSDEALEMIASWFRALGEPSRLRILRALEAGEMSITDLVTATGLTQANVSRHAQALAQAGMISRRKEGLSTICAIADPAIIALCDTVCSNLQARLSEHASKLSR